jgi:membrane fusion protein, multidrug efflux system
MSTEVEISPPKRVGNLKLIGLIALLIAAGVVADGIWSRTHARNQLTQWTDAQAVPTVATFKPNAVDPSQALILPGRLSAYVNAPIYARVPGYLHAWYADIGAHVKAGQLLGLIDTPDLDQQLQQAQADLQRSIANERLAATTAQRWTKMLAQDSVSQQEADEKTADLAAQQATVASNQANVRRLEALASFKRIIAPFDGVVTARRTDVGALINAGSDNGPDLFTVADVHQMRVYVSVPQNDAALIKPGMKASLTVPERPGVTFDARLVDTDNAIAPSSGTLLVQLMVDNKEGLLFPGEYTEVHFKLPTPKNALLIPASALIFRSGGLQVAVVDEHHHVVLKPVKVATDLGTQVQIASGLDAGDSVIDNPPDSLEQGDVVRVASADTATANHRASSPAFAEGQAHTEDSRG